MLGLFGDASLTSSCPSMYVSAKKYLGLLDIGDVICKRRPGSLRFMQTQFFLSASPPSSVCSRVVCLFVCFYVQVQYGAFSVAWLSCGAHSDLLIDFSKEQIASFTFSGTV